MKLFNLLALVSMLSLFAACGGGANNSSTSSVKKLTKQELIDNIKTAENEFYPDGEKFSFDSKKALNVVQAYEAYTSANPTDEASAEYLFKSAEIYRSLKDYKKSNECYEKILKDFPSYDKAAHSLFLMGFCYENDLKQLEKAKQIYQRFLDLYPEHELRDDVEFSLQNIGKSPEEIIKQFEKQQQEKSEA